MSLLDWDADKRVQFVIPASKVEDDIEVPFMFRIADDTGYTDESLTYIFTQLSDGSSSTSNKERIAFSQLYNGEEQILMTEIDIWDHTSSEAVLWVRPKVLSATYDNVFYLYYDADHDENPYISEANGRAESFFMDVDQAGDTDDSGVLPADLLEVNGIYHLWYLGNNGSYWSMHHCQSKDLDTWTDYQQVIDKSAYTYSSSNLHPGTVLYEDNIFKMWYSGYNGSYWRIIYCESDDGITWSNFQVVIDTDTITDFNTKGNQCCTILNDDGLYRMWYGGYRSSNATYQICYAESEDGITWTDHQIAISDFNGRTNDDYPWGRPSKITKEDGTYYLLLESYDDDDDEWALFTTTSDDGYTWGDLTHVTQTNLVDGYDTDGNIFGTVLSIDDTYVFLYGGYSDMWRILRGDSASLEAVRTPSQEVWGNYTMVHHYNSSYSYADSTYNKLDVESRTNTSPVTTTLGTSALEITTSGSITVADSDFLAFTESMGVTIYGQFDTEGYMISKNMSPFVGWGLLRHTDTNLCVQYDDFTGDDYSSAGIAKYREYGGGYILNNNYYLPVSAHLQPRTRFSGDFDIEIGFILDCPETVGWAFYFYVYLSNGYKLVLSRRYEYQSSGYRHFYRFQYYLTSWNTESSFQFAGEDLGSECRMRYVRSGTTITTYYDIGDGWVELGSYTRSSMDNDCYIDFTIGNWTNYPEVSVTLTHYKVNSGTQKSFMGFSNAYTFSVLTEDDISNASVSTSFISDWSTWSLSVDGTSGAATSLFVEGGTISSDLVSDDLSTNTADLTVGNTYQGATGQVSELWVSDNGVTSAAARFMEKMFKDNVLKISTNYIQGYVTLYNKAVETTVIAYKSDTYQLVGITTSSSDDGYYYMDVTTSEECFVVALDGDNYNHYILDKVTPQ